LITRAIAADSALRGGWTGAQMRLMATIMLINIIEGIDNQLLALVLSTIAREWQMAPGGFAPALTAGFVGAAIATPIGGWLGDRIGRKPVVVIGLGLFAGMTMGMGYCRSIGDLIALRAVAGLGLGLCLPPLLTLAVESVRPDQRGMAVGLTMFSMPLGLTLSGIVAPLLIAWDGWRGMFQLSGGAALLVTLVAALLLRETPAFLMRRADGQVKARRWAAALGIDVDGPAGTERRTVQPAFLSVVRQQAASLATLAAMIFLIYVIMSIVLNWLPTFLAQRGFPLSQSGATISAWSFAGLGGTLAAGWVASRLGAGQALRALHLALGIFLLAALLLCLWREHDRDTPLWLLCGVAGLVGMQVSGCITAIYAFASDCLAEHIRSTGIGLISLSGKIGAILGSALGFLVLADASAARFCIILMTVAVPACWLSYIAENSEKP